VLFRRPEKSLGSPTGSDSMRWVSRRPTAHGEWQAPTWYQALRTLEDGAELGDQLISAIHAEMAARSAEGGVGIDWPRMQLSNLRVRRSGLPEWWEPNGDLLLAAPDAKIKIAPPFLVQPGKEALVVLGARAALSKLSVAGSGALAAFGDHSNLYSTASAMGRSSILIGEYTTAAPAPEAGLGSEIEARNGGVIVVGADGMWAHGVRVKTDDDHAIREVATGKRINAFGGRLIVERHVWLAADVQLLGDCRIGADSVIGLGSFVSKSVLPANSVCVGRPAKPVRAGITWTREDLP
jgi:acetyltransferase-like isoleucine patch superfamily enzyme